MNLHLPLPARLRLLIQLPSLVSNIFRTQILRFGRDDTSYTQQRHMHLLSELSVQRQHERPLRRFDHR